MHTILKQYLIDKNIPLKKSHYYLIFSDEVAHLGNAIAEILAPDIHPILKPHLHVDLLEAYLHVCGCIDYYDHGGREWTIVNTKPMPEFRVEGLAS